MSTFLTPSKTLLAAVTSMLRSYSGLRRELSLISALELKNCDFGHQQMSILYRLTESACSMSELSTYTQSDPAATSRTVSGLESSQLIKRHSDPADARKTIIRLTAKGREQAGLALKLKNKIGVMLAETLSPTERKEFCRLLDKVTAGLKANRKSEVHHG
jgi:DNA-binding MarR family transcriptional regulator